MEYSPVLMSLTLNCAGVMRFVSLPSISIRAPGGEDLTSMEEHEENNRLPDSRNIRANI